MTITPGFTGCWVLTLHSCVGKMVQAVFSSMSQVWVVCWVQASSATSWQSVVTTSTQTSRSCCRHSSCTSVTHSVSLT